MLKFYTFWGAGESIGGGQAPPGVRVILTLDTTLLQTRRTAGPTRYYIDGLRETNPKHKNFVFRVWASHKPTPIL